jgi:hypothetical protein
MRIDISMSNTYDVACIYALNARRLARHTKRAGGGCCSSVAALLRVLQLCFRQEAGEATCWAACSSSLPAGTCANGTRAVQFVHARRAGEADGLPSKVAPACAWRREWRPSVAAVLQLSRVSHFLRSAFSRTRICQHTSAYVSIRTHTHTHTQHTHTTHIHTHTPPRP